MRVVFLGTPEFAVPPLKALIEAGHQVAAVFTQPDRPKGRGNALSESLVKRAAAALNIPVHQPDRIRRPENLDLLRRFDADIMVVVGYGQIIPQVIIDLPRYGIVNVHASLLPHYRGAAPIQWAIANGERITGVTIMQIDAGLDTGDMLLKGALHIGESETAPELSIRLASLGAGLLVNALEQIEAGDIRREKQDSAEATLAPILKKEDGQISWSFPASRIYNRLRGFTPWPGAFTTLHGQQFSILGARVEEEISAPSAGRIHIGRRRIFAGCGGNTTLELLEVQLQGKKRLAADAFLNGYKLAEGDLLGDGQ